MHIQLPPAITTFFAVSNGAAAGALTDCFASDAVVRDEAHTYQGQAAIHAWLRAAQEKYSYHTKPAAVVQEGDNVQVRATVTGNFPGSPAQLDYSFRVADNKITALEIN
jgi:ketosteroid isomerase-like protein